MDVVVHLTLSNNPVLGSPEVLSLRHDISFAVQKPITDFFPGMAPANSPQGSQVQFHTFSTRSLTFCGRLASSAGRKCPTFPKNSVEDPIRFGSQTEFFRMIHSLISHPIELNGMQQYSVRRSGWRSRVKEQSAAARKPSLYEREREI
jgi:hypothetical protein